MDPKAMFRILACAYSQNIYSSRKIETASFQGRNNYCKTDPDATFVHMEDGHMGNAQLKPGYNVQIGVDNEYIVAADIFQNRNDVWTMPE